jgi:transcriptional regulator with XRE-family HTH domain
MMERLAELRERRALTLRELAEMSGVAADTINQIELGHRRPRPSTLRKLARALEVDVEEFYAEPPRPKVLRPRSLDELLERAGLPTRWFTLPDEEFDLWWLGTDREETIRRFWHIDAEYRVIAAEIMASTRNESTVAPELQRQLGDIGQKAFGKHFGAKAAAPGKNESEEEFYERQSRGELRQFEPVELRKPAEELVAHAS